VCGIVMYRYHLAGIFLNSQINRIIGIDFSWKT
jgi:hypothetical protein